MMINEFLASGMFGLLLRVTLIALIGYVAIASSTKRIPSLSIVIARVLLVAIWLAPMAMLLGWSLDVAVLPVGSEPRNSEVAGFEHPATTSIVETDMKPMQTGSENAIAVATYDSNPVAAPTSPTTENAAVTTSVPVLPSLATKASGVSITGSLCAIWILGTAFFLLSFGFKLLQTLVCIARSVTCGEKTASLASGVAERLGLTRPVDVRNSNRINGPCTAGWIRPIVLLPESWIQGLSNEQMKLILAHELTHSQYRDSAWDSLARITTACWWFHPIVFAIVRQHRLACEHRCDAAAAAVGGGSQAYRRQLANWALVIRDSDRNAKLATLTALSMAERPLLLERLSWLKDARELRHISSRQKWLIATGLATFCMLVSIIHPTQRLLASIAVQDESPAVNQDLQEIVFPTGWGHAQVFVFESPSESDLVPGYMDFAWSGKEVGAAEGKASVPVDAFVGVEINGVDGYEKFLDGLPTDGIQRLDLKKIKLTDQTIKQLERITSLRQLHLSDCSVDEVDVEQIQGWPNLQSLDSRGSKDPPGLHRALVAMVSKSPKMQFFYDGTAMKLDEVRQFRGHEAPLIINVAFDSDAVETMQALSEIPGLVGLNARFENEVPNEFHHSFSKLKRLVWINWTGGKLDLDLLNSLSKTASIKKFHVQGRFEVSDEFVENLPQWKTVASITFNRSLSEYQQEILPDILLKMPGVNRLPKLSNVTSEQLEMLMQRESIEDLNIQGLEEGATVAQIAQVIEKHDDLRYLTLSRVPWTKELANAISKCDRLAHLDLKVHDFDGRFLDSADQLRRLQSMFLKVDGNAIDLAVLGEFPNLGSLQISLNAFEQNQWSFIADAKSLRRLNVNFLGYCDDAIVPWIKSNKSLRHFSTNQVAYFTDAGVKELSTCDHLESLTVEGFISEEAVMLLRKLPNLNWLSVWSDLIDEEAKKRIEAKFSDLEHLSLRDFSRSVTLGKDKIFRHLPDGGRDALDALEGKTLKEMMGDAMTEELQGQLKGQVVLVEFWGTWCGPCLRFIPELERLQKKYEVRGFKVLGVHSKAEADTAEDYLKANPKPWPNLIDSDGTLQKAFSVPSFPATYIFGTDGKLKIAVPMRHNLGPVLERYLAAPTGG